MTCDILAASLSPAPLFIFPLNLWRSQKHLRLLLCPRASFKFFDGFSQNVSEDEEEEEGKKKKSFVMASEPQMTSEINCFH